MLLKIEIIWYSSEPEDLLKANTNPRTTEQMVNYNTVPMSI